MITDEGMWSEIYAKHIVQHICHTFFRINLSLETLVVTKIYTEFAKIKIRFSHIIIIWKRFHNPPATQEIKLQSFKVS